MTHLLGRLGHSPVAANTWPSKANLKLPQLNINRKNLEEYKKNLKLPFIFPTIFARFRHGEPKVFALNGL